MFLDALHIYSHEYVCFLELIQRPLAVTATEGCENLLFLWKPFVLRYYCKNGWSENGENLLYPANATQKAKIINQDLPKHMENIWKHKQQSTQGGGAPLGAPPKAPPGCCLCFHVFSMCFGKSWLIILAFLVACAGHKRFSSFSDQPFLL